MPLPRFDRLPETKRRRILVAAGRAFADRGYDGASLSGALADAGVSRATAYYYFSDKADLFATVLRYASDHVLADAELSLEELDAASFWPSVEAFYVRTLSHVHRHPWMVRMVQAPLRLLSAGAPLEGPVREAMTEVLAVTHGLVARGRELGAVRTDIPESLLVSLVRGLDEAMDRWAAEHWAALDPDERDRLVRTFVSTVRRVASA